jgi:hypothetical protein
MKKTLDLKLYSDAYKALQPITRWVQLDQNLQGESKESRSKNNTLTQKIEE